MATNSEFVGPAFAKANGGAYSFPGQNSRRRFQGSGVKVYLLEFKPGESRHTSPPYPLLVAVAPELIFKARHPDIPDSFGFSRLGATVDHL